MRFLAALDPKDRRMLLILLALVALVLVTLAVVTPRNDPNDSPTPYSYRSGQHGAKAAYTLLEQSGYSIQRWEEPLSELASQTGNGSGAETVLILAEPFSVEKPDREAIAAILQHGGRVLATGLQGGFLLPGDEIAFPREPALAACEAQPDGISPLAGPSSGSGSIWIVPRASWKENRAGVRTGYTCAGQPVVVDYPVGKGTAVWWASSTPLENGSIERGRNLELLLASIGPPNPAQGQRIYWDESLHGAKPTQWDYVKGPVWPLLSLGSLGLALLTVLSQSRRSGPVRPLPQPPRTTPIEFLDALGALYRSTGATGTALQIAWERFRAQSALFSGRQTAQLDSREIAAVLERRFGPTAAGMEPDLIAAEEACWDENIKPKRALALIQTLRRHEETLRRAVGQAPSGVTLGA